MMRDWRNDLRQRGTSLVRRAKQASFTVRATAGFLVSRLSDRAIFRKIFSSLGIASRQERVQGTAIPVATIDEKRRAFLKYAFFGGTLFMAGKYVTPLINYFRGDTVLSEKTFQNFTVTETGKELRVTDDDGAELLIIDKEGF
jgi:hypothetical protein